MRRHGSLDGSGSGLLNLVAGFDSPASYAFEVALEATPRS
jgi:ABC-type thiamine transport system ATPase subunit